MALTIQIPSLNVAACTGGQFLGLPAGPQTGNASSQFCHTQDFSFLSGGTFSHGLSLFHQGPRTQACEGQPSHRDDPAFNPLSASIAPHATSPVDAFIFSAAILLSISLFRRKPKSPEETLLQEKKDFRKLCRELGGDTRAIDQGIKELERQIKATKKPQDLPETNLSPLKDELAEKKDFRKLCRELGGDTRAIDREIASLKARLVKSKARAVLHPDVKRAIEGDHDDPIPRPAAKPVAAPAVRRPRADLAVAKTAPIVSYEGPYIAMTPSGTFFVKVKDGGFQVDSLLPPLPPPLAHNFFGVGDPRLVQVEKSVLEENRPILDAAGQEAGKASICAGGRDGSVTMTCPDGTLLSAATSAAGRDHQQDGYYMSWFKLPDGTVAKIVVAVDGAGGMGGGDTASSAFAQGIHAAVIEAAKAGRVPLAGELWREGNLAVLKQRGFPENAKSMAQATGAATIFAIAGDKVTIASAADATGIHSRRPTPGSGYHAIGYTEVDHMKIGKGGFITNGIHENKPRLSSAEIQGGDRLVAGSDGLLENLIGDGYKDQGSSGMRDFREKGNLSPIPPPTQETFGVINRMMEATSGQPNAAQSFHDAALSNIKNPGRVFRLGGTKIQLPPDLDEDNIVAVVIQIGEVTPSTAVSIPPNLYGPMPAVGDDSAPPQ